MQRLKEITKIIPFFVLMAIGIVTCLIASQYGVIQYSSHFNIVWVEHFSKALSEGVMYPRWQTGYFDGLGAPPFYFYPSLPFYILSFLKALMPAMSMETFIFIGYGVIVGVSGLTCYTALKPLFNQRTAFVCAMLYEILPYHLLVDVFDRGAVSELTLYIWAPLCVSLILKGGLLHKSKYRLYVFTLCYVGVLFSHLPGTIIISGFLLMLQIIRFPNVRDTLKFMFFVVCAFLIAGVYIIPAIGLMDTIQSSFWTDFIYYQNYPFFAKGGSGRYLNTLISMIYAGYICVAIGLILYVMDKGDALVRRNILLPIMVVLAGVVFLLSPLSVLVWEHLPFMKFIQFPWRFFVAFDMALIILIALWLNIGQGFYKKSIVAIVIALAMFTAFNTHYMPIRQQATKGEIEEIIQTKIQKSYTSFEFITVDGHAPDSIDMPMMFASPINDATLTQQTTQGFTFDVSLNSPQQVEFKQYNYVGWSVHAGEKNIEISSSARGLMQMELPKGTYILSIQREKLVQEYVGQFISLFGLMLLFILWRRSPKFLQM